MSVSAKQVRNLAENDYIEVTYRFRSRDRTGEQTEIVRISSVNTMWTPEWDYIVFTEGGIQLQVRTDDAPVEIGVPGHSDAELVDLRPPTDGGDEHLADAI